MVKVLGAVSGKVSKSGRNTHQGYNYVMEADLLDAVRSELIANGVFVFSSIEETSQEGSITTVKTKHTFVDSESGETFEVFSAGQGADKQDKGIYKAITGASKYFLMKSFMVAGDDDPENDSKSAAPTGGSKKTSSKKSSPKKKTGGGFGKAAATSSFKSSASTPADDEIDEQEAHLDSAAPLDDIPF